ncbi:MAG: hypothetical protein L6R35_000213 [Caloplaca aegaea]|nr:MAG: hypothetical protein L6R35_000213 [Caloplaca aegaea]
MSSDDTYSSFLDQVNQDTGASKVSSESNAATAKVTDTDVPMELQHVDQYYTSEADEPFEPVSLQWNGKNMPSEDLIGHGSNVSTMSRSEFDPRSQYKEVLRAVERAGDGKSRIYRVGLGKTRIEYYVVGIDNENRRVIGLKARAVES